jgi:hypothetical protein
LRFHTRYHASHLYALLVDSQDPAVVAVGMDIAIVEYAATDMAVDAAVVLAVVAVVLDVDADAGVMTAHMEDTDGWVDGQVDAAAVLRRYQKMVGNNGGPEVDLIDVDTVRGGRKAHERGAASGTMLTEEVVEVAADASPEGASPG